MAKRGAEALACPARFRSYFPHAPLPKRSRSDLEWREPRSAVLRSEGDCAGGCKKRKRVAMAGGEDGEDSAGTKRPAGLEGSGAQKDLARGPFPEGAAPESEPLSRLNAEAAASGDHSNRCVAPKRPDEHEDDAWHYNSFQYWRSPLPAIDLCDILDLEKDDTLEAGDSSNIAFSEMET